MTSNLLPSTHDNGLRVLRGIAKFAPVNVDGSHQAAINMSPSSDFALTLSTDKSDYISAEEGVNEILDSTVISVTREAKLTCNNLSDEIRALFLIGDVTGVSQASGSVTGEMTDYVLPNRSVQLGGTANNGSGVFGLSAVTVEASEGADADAWAEGDFVVGDAIVPGTSNDHWYMATTAGTTESSEPTFPTDGSTVTDGDITWQDMGLIAYTLSDDYTLDADYGVLNIPSTGAIADAVALVPASARAAGKTFRLEVGYTTSAQSFNQIATKADATIEGKLYFYARNPKGKNEVYFAGKAQLAPDGDLALKSGSDYGAVGFGVTLAKPASGAALYVNGVPVGLGD